MPQLSAFVRYWTIAPPVHECFAAFAGYKAPTSGAAAETSPDDSEQFLRDLMAAGFSMPAGLLDEPLTTAADAPLPGSA